MIYGNLVIWLAALVVFVFPARGIAGELSPHEVAGRIQAVYDATSSMTADFTQITTSPMSRRKKEGNGTVILLKPGKMRWDYIAPDEQVIVCDGTNIMMYFANEKQMLVSDAKQYLESDVAYSFFAGNSNLQKDFDVSYPMEEELGVTDGQVALKIVPKVQHPQIDYITLWADKKYLVKKIIVVDKFGSRTEIGFTNITLNSTIPESSFSFTPPKGTEIIK